MGRRQAIDRSFTGYWKYRKEQVKLDLRHHWPIGLHFLGNYNEILSSLCMRFAFFKHTETKTDCFKWLSIALVMSNALSCQTCLRTTLHEYFFVYNITKLTKLLCIALLPVLLFSAFPADSSRRGPITQLFLRHRRHRASFAPGAPRLAPRSSISRLSAPAAARPVGVR